MENSIQLCHFCQHPFTSDRSTGKYCSDECKDDFHNRKKKLRRLELKRKEWMESLPRPECAPGNFIPQVEAYLRHHHPKVLQHFAAAKAEADRLEADLNLLNGRIKPYLKEMEAPQLWKQQIQARLKEIDSAVVQEQRVFEGKESGNGLEEKLSRMFSQRRLEQLSSQRQEQQTVLAVFERQLQEVNKKLAPLQEQYHTLNRRREVICQERLEKIRQLNYDLYPLAEEESNRIVLPEGAVIRHRKKRPKVKRPRVYPKAAPERVPGVAHFPVTAPSMAHSNGSGSGGNGNEAVGKHGDSTKGKHGYHSYFHYELGWDKGSGEPVMYRPSPFESDFLPNGHVLMAGKSGSGKTWLQYQLAIAFHQACIPFFWLDFDGGATSLFRKELPEGVALQQAHEGLGLNPLALSQRDGSSITTTCDWVSASLARSFGLGLTQRSVLRRAMEQVYQRENANLADSCIEGKDQPLHCFPTFNQVYRLLEENPKLDASRESMLGKLEMLLSSPLFEEPNLSLERCFTQSKVFNLQPLRTRETKAAASLLVLEMLYHYALSLGETKQIRMVLFVDEAHLLVGADVLSEMMRQARKAGLLLVLASQSPRDFAAAVLSEAGTYIALRLEAEDARMMASYFGAIKPKEKEAVQRLLVDQVRGEALIRNDHYHPYCQVQLKSPDQFF